MLHIGHFSFDEKGDSQEERHGYFTCVVEVKTPEDAVAKFAKHILQMIKRESKLKNIARVYIEDIIRIDAVPEEPIITRLQSSEGPFPQSISYSLPAVIKNGIEAYGVPSNVNKHENDDTGQYLYSNPFITFE
jgi:hypothetical protein